MGKGYGYSPGFDPPRHGAMTRRFFRNASVMAISEVAIRLKSVVLIPLLTHYFGTAKYGAWAQVAVFVGLVPPLIVLGTDTAISRFLPGKPPGHQARWFMGWIVGLIAVSCPVCLLLYLARDSVAELFFGTANQYAALVPVAVLYVLVTVLVLATRTWFRIQNKAALYSIVGIGLALIGTAAVVLVVVLHQGVYEAVLYEAAGDGLFAIVLLMRIAGGQGWPRPEMGALRPLVAFGLPILPAAYAMWAVNWLDRIFLVNYSNLAAIGVYSLAYSIGALTVQMVLTPIWTMFPNVVAGLWNQDRRDEVQTLFDHCTGVSILLVFPAIAGAAVISAGVLKVLAPASFAAGAPVVPIVLAGYGASMLAAYYEALFWCINRPGLSTVAVGVTFVVNLALNFALIPPFGYIGAAVATGVAFVAQLGFCIVLASRLRLIRTRLRTPVMLAVAALIMAASMLLVRDLVGDQGVAALVVIAAVGVAVYAATVMALGVVPPRRVGTEIRALFQPRRAAQRSAWGAAGSQ